MANLFNAMHETVLGFWKLHPDASATEAMGELESAFPGKNLPGVRNLQYWLDSFRNPHGTTSRTSNLAQYRSSTSKSAERLLTDGLRRKIEAAVGRMKVQSGISRDSRMATVASTLELPEGELVKLIQYWHGKLPEQGRTRFLWWPKLEDRITLALSTSVDTRGNMDNARLVILNAYHDFYRSFGSSIMR